MEVSSLEVTPTPFQGGSACSASTYNSGEDIATTPVQSVMNDAQIMGMLASPRYTQERDASVDRHELITLTEKIPCQVHHFPITYGETRRDVFTLKYGETRCDVFTQKKVETSIPRRKETMQNYKKFENSWRYKQIEHFMENRKLCLRSMKQIFIRKFFLKNKEVRYSQRQNSNYFCRRREPNMLLVR